MLPPRYTAIFIWRTFLIWLCLHALTAIQGGFRAFTLKALLLALAATVAVALLDAERRNERRYLANLGVSRAGIGIVVLVTAVILEVLVHLAIGS
jgi:hypothetical protein